MAKRFMQVCAGVFLLVASFEIGATTATGQTAGFRVIGSGLVVIGEAVYMIDTSNFPFGWKQLPQGNFDLPPVAASTLVNYVSGIEAITDTGEGWAKINGAWTDIGHPPPTQGEVHAIIGAKRGRAVIRAAVA
jgi:hypothetical protein